jgi:hypothetical protein
MARTEEKELLKKIVFKIGQNHTRLPASPLTGFMAIVGNLYDHELMVCGRAVNVWNSGWSPQSLTNEQDAENFLHDTLDSVIDGGLCPMSWVFKDWDKNDGYATKKSAFWRVIRLVVAELGIDHFESPEWPSHLFWSNLYKIVPSKGGNPSERLCSLQFDECKSLLEEEIRSCTPKRLLFLTGLAWAEPFLADFDPGLSVSPQTKYVEATGKVNLIYGNQSRIVVAKHPQGKKEDIWVREVVNAFNSI